MNSAPVESLASMTRNELEENGYFTSEQALENFLNGPGFTSFGTGRPGEHFMRRAVQQLQKATVQRYTEELASSCDLMQYGDVKGEPSFRIQIAKFLSTRYQYPVHSDNIMCSAGASQGLNFLTTNFFRKGDFVFVEDPTYFLALVSFRHDLELNIIAVSKDEDGIDTDDLETKFKDHLGDRAQGDERPFRCMLYLIPCFHNPTGTCTPPERCRKIISVARKYDALVVCDDVYNLLSWIPADQGSDRPYKSPPRLFAFDDPSDSDFKGHVVSNGSVSKFLGPGLRLGWLEVPDRIMEMLTKNQYLNSGGSFNHLTAGLVGTMLKMGLVGPHLDYVCDVLKASVDAMTEVLQEELPSEIKFRVPQGGYFFWIELPESVDVSKLSELCKEKYKINFAPGKNFSFAATFTHHIRLSFSYYPTEKLVDGTKKLCQGLREYMASASA